MDRDRRISRAGDPGRTTTIQLAWLWLRYQPGSALAGWFRERVGALAGRTRQIAIVAMARELLIALWRYVETGLLPEGSSSRHRRRLPPATQSSAAIRGARPFSHWQRQAAAFQVGRVLPGPRLVHEAFWCGPATDPTACKVTQPQLRDNTPWTRNSRGDAGTAEKGQSNAVALMTSEPSCKDGRPPRLPTHMRLALTDDGQIEHPWRNQLIEQDHVRGSCSARTASMVSSSASPVPLRPG